MIVLCFGFSMKSICLFFVVVAVFLLGQADDKAGMQQKVKIVMQQVIKMENICLARIKTLEGEVKSLKEKAKTLEEKVKKSEGKEGKK